MLKRLLKRVLVFGLIGLGINLAVAWLVTGLLDVQAGRSSSAQSFDGEGLWSITRYDRPGAMQIRSTRVSGANWSPQQATGAPDTPNQGDQVTAWASSSADAQGTEWLILEYADAVVPRAVHVYESYNPGALIKVTLFDEAGAEHDAWSGTDPSPRGSTGATAVSKIPIHLDVKTRRVKLHIDSLNVPGWNEIDAVGLVCESGNIQWARRAWASTTYASGYTATTGNAAMLAPPWSGLQMPGRAYSQGDIRREDLLIDARGWPMLTMMSRRDLTPAAPDGSLLGGGSVPPGARRLANTTAYTGSAVPPAFITGTTPSAAPAVPEQLPLPLRPVWAGLLGNTAFYGAAVYLIWLGMVVPRRFVREVGRFRHGQCIQCGYDLGYDFIKGCPECGWRRVGGDRGEARR